MIFYRKVKVLFFPFLFVSKFAFTQHVDEGYYNDWDFAPHGVYGNLRLTKVTARTCYKIEKDGPQKVVVRQLNPSGTVVNVATVTFSDGLISELDQANEWGEIYEYRSYQQKEKNTFRVTDLLNGKNAFLPCKYALYLYKDELLSEVRYYSAGGQLREDGNGVAIIKYKRYADPIRFAERAETSLFDSQEQPVISKSAGYHTLAFVYDEHDNKISQSFLGIHDELIKHRPNGVAKIQFTYDADNNPVLDEYHGLDDKICSNAYGVAGVRRNYEMGYLMKTTRLDTLRNATRSLAAGDGIAIINYEYDTAGNQTREAYFDEQEKPMNNHDGIQEIAYLFSPGNLLTRKLYFDQYGHPCIDRDSINSTVYVRDEKNRILSEASYGVNGQPLKTDAEEVFLIKKKYDRYGREVSETYWADSTTRMTHWDGSYETATNYNEDGLVTEYNSLDENQQPFMTEDGSSTMRLIYNADDRLEERQFLYDNKLVQRTRGVSLGYSIIKYGYDEGNRRNELTFWTTDEKPVNATVWMPDSISVHRIVFLYKGNKIVAQRYYLIGATEPFKILDCLENDYLSLSGISMGRKNGD